MSAMPRVLTGFSGAADEPVWAVVNDNDMGRVSHGAGAAAFAVP